MTDGPQQAKLMVIEREEGQKLDYKNINACSLLDSEERTYSIFI